MATQRQSSCVAAAVQRHHALAWKALQPCVSVLSEYLDHSSQKRLTSTCHDSLNTSLRSQLSALAHTKKKNAIRDEALQVVMMKFLPSDYVQGIRNTFKSFLIAKRSQIQLTWTQRCMRIAAWRPRWNWTFGVNLFYFNNAPGGGGALTRLIGTVVNINVLNALGNGNIHVWFIVSTTNGQRVLPLNHVATPKTATQYLRNQRSN